MPAYHEKTWDPLVIPQPAGWDILTPTYSEGAADSPLIPQAAGWGINRGSRAVPF